MERVADATLKHAQESLLRMKRLLRLVKEDASIAIDSPEHVEAMLAEHRLSESVLALKSLILCLRDEDGDDPR